MFCQSRSNATPGKPIHPRDFCPSKPIRPSNVITSKLVCPSNACLIKTSRPSKVYSSKPACPSNICSNLLVQLLFFQVNRSAQLTFAQVNPSVQVLCIPVNSFFVFLSDDGQSKPVSPINVCQQNLRFVIKTLIFDLFLVLLFFFICFFNVY